MEIVGCLEADELDCGFEYGCDRTVAWDCEFECEGLLGEKDLVLSAGRGAFLDSER